MFASIAMAGALWLQAASAPKPIWPGYGVNIHFTAPALGEMELLGKAGFQYVRMDFVWSATETAPGVYDFSAYDGLLAQCKARGIRPLFILDYGNDLYQAGSPSTPAARDAFAKWAKSAVEHFRGQEILWEIWNEPNLGQFWKPEPSARDYTALAVATAKGMREADPDCRIIAPGVSGVDMKFLSDALTPELLGLIDGVSLHPYREGGPESVWEDIGQVRGLIREVAPEGRKDLPIICSEWGYSTAKGAVSEGRQAMYLSRMWLINRAAGVPVSIFYDWKDDGPNPEDREHRFGVVRENFDLKPAFIAAKELIAKFNGCTSFRRVPQGDPLRWVIVGAGNGKLVQAKWYQKDAGISFSNLPLSVKANKSLYASLTSGAAKATELPPVSFSALNIAFAPPIDDGGWCAVVDKMVAQPVKMEFRYRRSSNGANVTCYSTVEKSRFLEALATSDDSTTLTAGMAGKTDRPRKVEVVKFDPAGWSSVTYVENVASKAVEVTTAEKGFTFGYQFGKGWQYACLAPVGSVAIPTGATKLNVWIKPDGSGNALRARFRDESGQTFQVDLGVLDSATDRAGWRLVSISLSGEKANFWGGDGSGKPKGKLEWEALLLVDSINRENPRSGNIEVGPAAYEY